MTRINNINYIIFIFGQLCLLTITEAFYDTIKVKIKNGDEIIELNWKRTGQYLANENLPIWYAERNAQPRIVPQALSNLSPFITYHDVEKSSAVIFCTNIKRFYGIIDTRFYVVRLPLNHDPNVYYEVDGNYIYSIREKDDYFHDSENDWLLNLFSNGEINYINSLIANAGSEFIYGPSSQLPYQEQHDHNLPSTSARDEPLSGSQTIYQSSHPTPSTILYPEILVFVTSDIFNIFRGSNSGNAISLLMLYYLTYFNAIDMLFAKLTTDDVAIRINIAGIVIESEPNAFSYHFWNSPGSSASDSSPRLHDGEILQALSGYIIKYRDIFVEDSFDFFFISTSHKIGSNTGMIQATSTPPINVYGQRVSRTPPHIIPGSVVYRKSSLLDYVVATREIAKLMHIEHDFMIEGLFDITGRCHSIMQKRNTHCRNCLKWTVRNKHQLELYVRFNVDHCFLLNYPRSIYPYDQPRVSIYPEDQCMCYHFSKETLNPFYMVSVPADSCDKRMQCSYKLNFQVPTPLPIDGTPCEGPNKVCWRKECIEIDQTHKTDNSDRGCHHKAKRLRTSDNRK